MKFVRALSAMMLVVATCTAGVNPAVAQSATTHSFASTQSTLLGSSPSTATAFTVSGPTLGKSFETGRVIVRLKGADTAAAIAALIRSARGTTTGAHDMRHGRLTLTVPKGVSASAFASQLTATGKVDYAVPDYARQFVGVYTPPSYSSPNDQYFTDTHTWRAYYDSSYSQVAATYPYGTSWWLRDIRAPQAWAEGYTGPNVTGLHPLRAAGDAFEVAVIDSGLYSGHEDNGVNIVGGVDFFDHQAANGTIVEDNDVTPVDPSLLPASEPLGERQEIASHGTCVSGEIGATVNNGVGTVGVGYDTKVVVHKVMGIYRNGTAAIDDGAVVEAIMYSADQGAKVINMSFGGYDYSQAYTDAINYARSKGVVIVAAKGNDASGSAFYPADTPGVVSVGALDKNPAGSTIPADFTNYRKTSLDIMAPGSFIVGLTDPSLQLTSFLNQGYSKWDGTSMASPIVAGAIAWLWRAAPSLSANEITNVVLTSAHSHGAYTHFPFGWRELDMYAAYQQLEASYPLLLPPTVPSQTVAAVTDDTVHAWWPEPLGNQRGVTYDLSIDGGSAVTTTTTQGDLSLGVGPHTLSVTAHSDYNWDDGTAVGNATIDVLPAAEGTASLGAHISGGWMTSLYTAYGQAASIDASLADASGTALSGAVVTLESSTDGSSFSAVVGSKAVNVSSGMYRITVAPTSRTFYRLAFAGVPGTVGACTSNPIMILPGLSLPTPSAKSSIKHTSKLAVTGTVKPAHASSSRYVQIKVYRWSGRAWVLYSRAWTAETYRGFYSSYVVSLKLKKGGYRLYAYSGGDGAHAATTSGYRSVLVK